MFNLDKCTIRKAELNDIEGLNKIAKTIWDGHDYLPLVADKWIREGGFFVAEHDNKLVGCTKISLFPGNVMWFEGLRVHGKFHGLGIGKLLNAFAFNYAMQEKRLNPALKFEFCTYYKNLESIHLAQKLGFEVVEEYYVMAKRGIKKTIKPTLITDYDMSIFDRFEGHIPCGWRAINNIPQSLNWIKANCRIFQTPAASYLIGGLSGNSILPLGEPQTSLQTELPYFQHFYGSYKFIELILPPAWADSIPGLINKGFHFWDKETKANMYIFQAKTS